MHKWRLVEGVNVKRAVRGGEMALWSGKLSDVFRPTRETRARALCGLHTISTSLCSNCELEEITSDHFLVKGRLHITQYMYV